MVRTRPVSIKNLLNCTEAKSLIERHLPDVQVGFARLDRPLSIDFYDAFLKEGMHGELEYLARHRDQKADPRKWISFAHSAIVLTFHYVTKENITPHAGKRVALYATYTENQEDYHHEIRRRLAPILQELNTQYPEASFRLGLDAEPVLERDLAYRAGLGWIGKNTCLIDRDRGSLFFIAEILTSLELADETRTATIQSRDHCGTCTRCLDICPTGALLEPRKLDPRLCISYWTIESKSVAPRELRSKFGDWFFGCDLCQTVCPWNGKVFGRDEMQAQAQAVLPRDPAARTALVDELREILTLSNRELERRFTLSPLKRARGSGLKRNALYVVGNLKLHELTNEVSALLGDPKLGTLAKEILKDSQDGFKQA